jgi:hypothetical protein
MQFNFPKVSILAVYCFALVFFDLEQFIYWIYFFLKFVASSNNFLKIPEIGNKFY